MTISDPKRTIRIQTDQGSVYVHADFQLENNQPIMGFVRITDNITKQVFWFNINAISWIGPAE